MPGMHKRLSHAFSAVSLVGLLAANALAQEPVWPTLPEEEKPPERTEPLFFYMEGPQMVASDPFWALMNTRFQIRADTRVTSAGYWAGNNFPGDNPSDTSVFRPYAGPTDFAQQVINTLASSYAAANLWPVSKPKLHSFELIGPNGMSSPWRDVDNPNDYVAFGGSQYVFHLSSATVATSSGVDSITSSDLATFGPGGWQASHAYNWGDLIVGNGFCFFCTQAGTSGSSAPTWDNGTYPYSDIADGGAKWNAYNFGRVLIKDFASSDNNGVFVLDKKLASNQFRVQRHAAGGDAYHFTSETHSNVDLYLAAAPDLWHSVGNADSMFIALDNFEAMKDALDNVSKKELPEDISRSFVYYVEDDESLTDYKPDSVAWYNIPGGNNMPAWATDGLFQVNAADLRAPIVPVDGVYTIDEMLDRAGDILSGGTLPAPTPFVSPWAPGATTLRAWQWINARSGQSAVSVNRFLPFKYVFGDIPCGNWNNGPTSGDPNAHLIIEPDGGEMSTGISIDNYTGSALWGMSIPGMYAGVLGDYRGPQSSSPFIDDSRWSTQEHWKAEAIAQSYPFTTPGLVNGSVAQSFQIGQVALDQYAASVKRNYGYGHVVMPSLSMEFGISGVSTATDRKWILIRLANDLSRAYMAGKIDAVWIFEPNYKTNSVLRDCWYVLASQVQRLTTIPVDYDKDGTLDIDDVFVYLSLWNNFDPIADFNDDGQIDQDDLDDFLAAWFG